MRVRARVRARARVRVRVRVLAYEGEEDELDRQRAVDGLGGAHLPWESGGDKQRTVWPRWCAPAMGEWG